MIRVSARVVIDPSKKSEVGLILMMRSDSR
jgi:hypothetical protein